jgi:hypothetical protein
MFRSVGDLQITYAHLHFTDSAFDSDEEGSAHDTVADVELGHLVDPRNGDHVAVIQPVTRVQFQLGLGDSPGRIAKCVKFIALPRSFRAVGISPGVKFDRVDTEIRRRLNLSRFGIEKEGDLDTGVATPAECLGDPGPVGGDVQSPFGGQLLPPFGYEGHLVGTNIKGQSDDSRLGGHLEVEPDLHSLAKQPQVSVLDVTPILAKMNRNSISASEFGQSGRPDRVRFLSPPRLTESGDMIDINTESRHWRFNLSELPMISYAEIIIVNVCPGPLIRFAEGLVLPVW